MSAGKSDGQLGRGEGCGIRFRMSSVRPFSSRATACAPPKGTASALFSISPFGEYGSSRAKLAAVCGHVLPQQLREVVPILIESGVELVPELFSYRPNNLDLVLPSVAVRRGLTTR